MSSEMPGDQGRSGPRRVSPDDLLVFLAVAQTGRFTSAAERLGINHTTVSRRITALERAAGGKVLAKSEGGWETTDLGNELLAAAETVEAALAKLNTERGGTHALSGVIRMITPDAFGGLIVGAAMAQLRTRHPGLQVEMINVARRAQQHRVGVDLEVVVGKPEVHRAQAFHLADYRLGLYAAHSLLERDGRPRVLADLSQYPLIYFIDSMLDVDDLDLARSITPSMRQNIGATNVFVHLETARAGAGVAILPCYLANRYPDLTRLFPRDVDHNVSYWMVARPEALRRPVVAEFVRAVAAEAAARRGEMGGRTR
ncbi:LysR family transcriptional regulator [Hoyosella sp. YIM 151337]|uniref:LysR family transcriptional regulator n=1 Tax=Hoyosella sp. YIM 151337 TaxID=2992742 RepID=UPI0022358BA2|nr:LysR family transcriptional regulator [Hoyosella sp. YIM 151337]MCW4353622.1 LysR family transcriptional regulator [Hoyosella sp. YIM 151337]